MALKPLKYSLKHVAMALLLHNAAAGVGTALPPYKHRRGFFARGGGFAIGNTGPSDASFCESKTRGACFCCGFWYISRRTIRATGKGTGVVGPRRRRLASTRTIPNAIDATPAGPKK